MMINLSLVVLGIFSYFQLGVDLDPKIDFPFVVISTTLPGAQTEQVESQITKPIEDAVAVLSGVYIITSTSSESSSTVVIQFVLEKNPDVAAQDVRDKIALIRNQFPVGTQDPVVQKYDPSSMPVVVLAVYGERDPKEISEFTRRNIKDFISSVDGVGQVNMVGTQYREIQVNLKADKMDAYNLSVNQVTKALQDQNADIPGGKVTSKYNEYTLRTSGRLKTIDAFNDIVVSSVKGTPIKIKDIGFVVDGTKELKTISRFSGKPTLTLQIVKNSDANLVDVVDKVKARVKELEKMLPPDIHVMVVEDTSVYIKESVHDIMEHLVIGGGLASLMVLIFMGSLRSTFIAAIAIPASIIATFTIMKMMNFTLNYMTLLALALVVGLVIDDAIVVLENIWRLMEEEGYSAYEASIKGIQDVGPAVFATTLSLMVLFVPVAFMSGLVGRYFQSYGLTMAAAIFFSMIVSFTLTPMLCSKLLKPPVQKGKKEPGKLTRILQDIYEVVLKWSLRWRWVIILFCVASLWWGKDIAGKLGSEFTTAEDRSEYRISIKMPKGWPIERTSDAIKPLEEELLKMRGVDYILTTIGTPSVSGDQDNMSSDISKVGIYVHLIDYNKRKDYTQFQAMLDARKLLRKYKLFKSSVQLASGAGGSAGSDLMFSLQGEDLNVINKASSDILKKLSQIPGYVDIDTDFEIASPEIKVNIDRDRAADLNVNIADVSSALRTLVGGDKITNYQEGIWLYDVRTRLTKEDRNNPDSIKKMYITSADGKLVSLAGIADINTGLGPSTITHFNRQRNVTISANLENYPQVKAMEDVAKIVKDLNLPPGYSISYRGSSQYVGETASAFAMAFVLAVIFMYMVLASQFENLMDPFIILLTMPLSIPFALFALYITGKTLNLFSALGLFLLFGIVKKNAILQIDHTNTFIRQGMEFHKAIIRANRERLRPILMTTLTIVVGMLPVALAGANAAQRSPMAVVVVGGQSLCLVLTLLLVPVALSYVEDLQRIKQWPIWSKLKGKSRSDEKTKEKGEE